MNDPKFKHSKIVYIRRAAMSIPETEALDGDKPEIKDYFDNAFRAVGSYWPKGSMRPGTGLTLVEENLLLPYILNIPAEDRDFRERSTNFFHEISSTIPPTLPNGEGGLKLEIGINEPDEELSLHNLPYNIMDFIRYRQIKGHPEVAADWESCKGDRRKHYFVYDPVDVQKTAVNKEDMKADAYEGYLSIRKDVIKVNQYLTLLKVDTALYKGEEAAKLQSFIEKDPESFLKVHKDPNREPKALMLDLINANILEVAGTRVLVKETGFQVGANVKETIAYIKDPAQSREVTQFKAALQDYRKKKNIATEASSVPAAETEATEEA